MKFAEKMSRLGTETAFEVLGKVVKLRGEGKGTFQHQRTMRQSVAQDQRGEEHISLLAKWVAWFEQWRTEEVEVGSRTLPIHVSETRYGCGEALLPPCSLMMIHDSHTLVHDEAKQDIAGPLLYRHVQNRSAYAIRHERN